MQFCKPGRVSGSLNAAEASAAPSLFSREINTKWLNLLLFLLFFPIRLHLLLLVVLNPASPLLCCRYRARVEKVESPAKVHVFYIDYGNVSKHTFKYFTPT